jgi:hypothetical protein
MLLALPLSLGLQIVDFLATRQRISIMLDWKISRGNRTIDIFLLSLELIK